MPKANWLRNYYDTHDKHMIAVKPTANHVHYKTKDKKGNLDIQQFQKWGKKTGLDKPAKSYGINERLPPAQMKNEGSKKHYRVNLQSFNNSDKYGNKNGSVSNQEMENYYKGKKF